MPVKLGKLSVFVFIVYSFWFKEAFTTIPLVLYGSALLSTFFAVFEIVKNKKLYYNRFFLMLLLFGVFSFASGIFVCADKEWFFSLLITCFAFCIVCYDAFVFTKVSNSSDWLLNAILLAGLLCAMQCIFFGYGYKTEVIVTTMGPNNNPNTLGFIMILSMFALISKKKYNKKWFVVTMLVLALFLYIIILCGSRKCLICSAILLVLYLFAVLKSEKKNSPKRIAMIAVIGMGVLLGTIYVLTKFTDTAIFARLLLISRGGSNRAILYKDAFLFWKSSPIIGIGFGQYQILSSYHIYSHSTYAEILSCTGLIGFLVFYVPIIKDSVFLLKKYLYMPKEFKFDYFMVLVMLLIEFILGLVQIWIYDFSHLIILTYIFYSASGFQNEYIDELQENKSYDIILRLVKGLIR